MASGPGAPAGILAIDKPAGLTSHDVVARVRRALGVRRVGHAGTLDPMATGLLVALVGAATRLARYVEAGRKTYEARVVFGTSTDTDDAEGAVTATAEVPARVADSAYAAGAVAALVGDIDQVPPAYAAIKVDGRRAYDLARRGEAVELPARAVTVYSARLGEVSAGPPITWDITIVVSKGTYVRSLARDLGVAHGTRAHLGALRRTRIGELDVAAAAGLDDVTDAGSCGVAGLFVDPLAALGVPAMLLGADEVARVSHGVALPIADDALTALALPGGAAVALVADEHLLAMYARNGDRLEPEVVLAEPLALRAGSTRCGAAVITESAS
jgi:tRNA pseudouridine55 synthase